MVREWLVTPALKLKAIRTVPCCICDVTLAFGSIRKDSSIYLEEFIFNNINVGSRFWTSFKLVGFANTLSRPKPRPQDLSGPLADCVTRRVKCRYKISSLNIRQQFMSELFMKFSFIHLIRSRVDNARVFQQVSMNASMIRWNKPHVDSVVIRTAPLALFTE